MPPRLVLIGPPGAGKTTTAALLAAQLGIDARDTDADIEATLGSSIADIFVVHGEAHFRELEAQAVATALSEADGVLSVGGGSVMDERSRALLGSHPCVVYLTMTLADAARRTGLSTARPLLAVNPRATLRRLMADRDPLYREVADVVLDTSELDPPQVVQAVLAALPASPGAAQ